MLKRSLLLCGLAVISLSSCIFDPKEDKECTDCNPPVVYERLDLTQKWHVLNNILYTYYNRTNGPDAYSELLDDNFVFFFAPGDVGGGLPEQWPRTDEVTTTTRLLESNDGTPVGPECRDIRLTLNYNADTMTWLEVIPEHFPGETWYTTTVFYTFTFEMAPDQTYIAVPGAKAQFTVRNVGSDTTPSWKLVEFRDLAVSG